MNAKRATDMAVWGTAQARRRLRTGMSLFFVILAVPLAALLYLSLHKLYSEAFLQQRFAAEQTADAIRKDVAAALNVEETRPFDQYSFYTVANVEFANQQALQRSPLSELAPMPSLAGLVGYFQIAPDGELSSPLLPQGTAANTLSPQENMLRQQKFQTVAQILGMASGEPSKLADKKAAPAPLPGLQGQASAPPSAMAPMVRLKGSSSSNEFADVLDKTRISQESLLNRREDGGVTRYLGAAKSGPLAASGPAEKQEKALQQEADFEGMQKARKESANIISLDEHKDVMAPGGAISNFGAQNSPAPTADAAGRLSVSPKITSFEAEVDPFQVLSLQEGYLVFFRKAWHGQRRIIQGAIVETKTFFESFARTELSQSSLPPAAALEVNVEKTPILTVTLPELPQGSFMDFATRRASYAGRASTIYSKNGSQNTTHLFSTALPEPLGQFELSFSVPAVILPPGSHFVMLLGLFLSFVLLAGMLLLYRLGSAQISLAQKRNDFVSAVSHELKTPLTSIRMYGEMLRNNWVSDEEKKRSYYDYIFHESERLSRLIANVLRLSRLTNDNDVLDLYAADPQQLLEAVRLKVEQIAKNAGFTLTIAKNEVPGEKTILVDIDALSQIAINLVDNAVKFSRDAARKEIEIGFRFEPGRNGAVFYVRDYGPGVPKAEQRKIFRLFYRSESEITRKTSGTGIGLALVKELAARMGARADYRGRDPGAEFQVVFNCGNRIDAPPQK